MLNKYPLWKYLLLLGILLVGLVYALPNLFGEDPAVQVLASTGSSLDPSIIEKIEDHLKEKDIPYISIKHENSTILTRFSTPQIQLQAKEAIKEVVGENYIVALNLAPKTPAWLTWFGASPMKLGLDLRGGVHFLMEVDVESSFSRYLESALGEIRSLMRENKLRYSQLYKVDNDKLVVVSFDSEAGAKDALKIINQHFKDYDFIQKKVDNRYQLLGHIKQVSVQEITNSTVEKSISTLRNRVNELGVSEAVVQRQGLNHIIVELPGIQDTARAKDILGKTATLAFHLEATEEAKKATPNITPPGTKWYTDRGNRQVLLSKRVILTGDSIIGAVVGSDGQTGQPAVHVTVANKGLALWQKTTLENVGVGLGVVYIETKTDSVEENGESVKKTWTSENLISFATIRSPLGNRFQITGFTLQQAQDLAILLRAGSLPATITIVEERTVGPSLGQENIRLGKLSIAVGLGLVVVAMLLYYSVFGFIANLALVANVILLVAILSLVGATLTLPGIAGIVLTIGMAVDANVLIFERIREELRLGLSAQAAIHAGFERALSTIIDANLTTLIVAVILFSVGTGPIRGFAITLTIGILTSMLTAIMGTRAMVNIAYGGRTVQKLRVGI
ncbi:protein translocase subunit SecD [Candidatus Berkiella cookevillensis]|uniref:Protein translocase subunit SecD n=1 Tax=Candidatus Berkiella cookevillensis TaxID=437022 RepID=A0A0Q9YLZ4_9GAMM|nr:protein translocase subunit SecD [Candidatus Berkiella cookevillensis]MCS5708731.1 protein translocase subunit SecD [Candidatus Berkiella cookevillensis]